MSQAGRPERVQARPFRRGLPSSLRPSPLISTPVWLPFASESPSFPQPFTRICRCSQKSVYGNCYTRSQTITYLKSILAREALVTVRAGERLHSQMNSFMALEIVIAVETLGTLVAFKRSVRRGGGHAVRGWMTPI